MSNITELLVVVSCFVTVRLVIGLFGLIGMFGVTMSILVGKIIDALPVYYASLFGCVALIVFQVYHRSVLVHFEKYTHVFIGGASRRKRHQHCGSHHCCPRDGPI